MKKLSLISIVVVLLIVLSACYELPKMDEDMTFLISGESRVNGYWGRAVATCGEIGFVGDSMIDATIYTQGSDPAGVRTHKKVLEGGVVSLVLKDPDVAKNPDGLWSIMRYPDDFIDEGLRGKPVTFTSSDCAIGDEFGATMYYAPKEDSGRVTATSELGGLLFVSALMADRAYNSDESRGVNSGTVYIFEITGAITPESVYNGTNPKQIAQVSLDLVVDMTSFLPPAMGSDKSTQILPGNVNPGLGFGFSMNFDWETEILVIGAPYESYYKDLQNNGNDILISKAGAAYIFEPKNAGDYTDTGANSAWKMTARIMPEWNVPQYKNEVYVDNAGLYIGEEVFPVLDGNGAQEFKILPNDRPNYYFGKILSVGGEKESPIIAVGVPSAVFQYFRPTEATIPDGGFYRDGKEVAKPTGADFYKYIEMNPGTGTIFVYQKEIGTGDWKFKQRMDRSHYMEKAFATVSPGSYIYSGNTKSGAVYDYYGRGNNEGQGIGNFVEIYGDSVITGIPTADIGYAGYRDDIVVTRVWNDVGGLVFFDAKQEAINKLYQLNEEKNVIIGPPDGRGRDDWALFGKTGCVRGNVLAIGSTGFDFSVLQQNVGRVQFFELPELTDNTSPNAVKESLTEYPNSVNECTTRELYRGYQQLGLYMDFSLSGNLLCGVPDFSLVIYYNNPYVQWYSMDRCGAVYAFRWLKKLK